MVVLAASYASSASSLHSHECRSSTTLPSSSSNSMAAGKPRASNCCSPYSAAFTRRRRGLVVLGIRLCSLWIWRFLRWMWIDFARLSITTQEGSRMSTKNTRLVVAALVGALVFIVGLVTRGSGPIIWLSVIAGIAFLAYRDYTLKSDDRRR